VSKSALSSAATRISLNQILESYRNADRLSRDVHFAYHTGLRYHIATYGMYGFAILSSVNYRQTMQFAMRYQQLATPLCEIVFTEDGQRGIWTLAPVPLPRIDARLYRFIVEKQFGIILSLHRDVMDQAFAPRELHVAFAPPNDASEYPGIFGCPVLFRQSENRFIYDAAWLDGTPKLGSELTYPTVVKVCDDLIEQLSLQVGLAGKVRKCLMVNLMRPIDFDAVASDLHMSGRTLRRKLKEEKTSFRKVADQLRMDMAIKYLRDSELTVEDIASTLGFSDAANFRHAFRRWTKASPHEFRGISGRV
jgi:AraC-like DNA-binding protein